jgi:hypothetical protein
MHHINITRVMPNGHITKGIKINKGIPTIIYMKVCTEDTTFSRHKQHIDKSYAENKAAYV